MKSALGNIVAFVSGLTVGVHADSGLHLTAEFTCVSEPGAKRVDDALRGGIGLARLSTRDNDDQMLRIYDAIHVDHQDRAFI